MHIWDIAKCPEYMYRGVLISRVSFKRGSTVSVGIYIESVTDFQQLE